MDKVNHDPQLAAKLQIDIHKLEEGHIWPVELNQQVQVATSLLFAPHLRAEYPQAGNAELPAQGRLDLFQLSDH